VPGLQKLSQIWAPELAVNDPGAHAMHVARDETLVKVPARQGSAEELPGQKLPGMHGEQAAAPGVENVCGEHGRHAPGPAAPSAAFDEPA